VPCIIKAQPSAAGKVRTQFYACSIDGRGGREIENQPTSPATGSRSRCIVNSIFCDCSSRQLSTSVWYRSFGKRSKYSAASFWRQANRPTGWARAGREPLPIAGVCQLAELLCLLTPMRIVLELRGHIFCYFNGRVQWQ
jgi:hypothetical protein